MGLYPYKNGALYLDGIGIAENDQLDGVFASPPVSTEQVLHPEKHGKDYPHIIAAPYIEDAALVEFYAASMSVDPDSTEPPLRLRKIGVVRLR